RPVLRLDLGVVDVHAIDQPRALLVLTHAEVRDHDVRHGDGQVRFLLAALLAGVQGRLLEVLAGGTCHEQRWGCHTRPGREGEAAELSLPGPGAAAERHRSAVVRLEAPRAYLDRARVLAV